MEVKERWHIVIFAELIIKTMNVAENVLALQRGEIVFGLKRANFTKPMWEIAQRMKRDGASLEDIKATLDRHEAEFAARIAKIEATEQAPERRHEEFLKSNGYTDESS